MSTLCSTYSYCTHFRRTYQIFRKAQTVPQYIEQLKYWNWTQKEEYYSGPRYYNSNNERSNTRTDEPFYDITIIGGGIIGLATAMELSRKCPTLKLAVLEKENGLAQHQSGHNSGVVHCGIYYQPGSLKARLCVEGSRLAYSYFEKNQIPYKKCGKLIVAFQDEIPRLKDLFQRGLKNNVSHLKLVESHHIKDYEPYCKGALAIWSPETGIVDWALVTQSYASNFKKTGGKIHLNYCVHKLQIAAEGSEYPVLIFSSTGDLIRSKYVLTCGGLHSDRLAEMSGCSREPRIIPFRGEYLLLSPEKCNLIRGNIYPVPDPRFPFLGVHFTPRMDGSVWLGPNAILAFKREGYSWTDFDLKDFVDSIKYKGFQKLALKYAKFGGEEMIRSAFTLLQLRNLQKYIPDIKFRDITRGPAGVRAQAMDLDGNLVDDFVFDSGTHDGELSKRVLHVRNCPSPGATSSLAIASIIVNKIHEEFVL